MTPAVSPTQTLRSSQVYLRHFAKITCTLTLFLIFAGGMVTSTGSGLAVPDWPLSYGSLFPPMVGGVFYEHGHRMIASVVGLLTLILTIWMWRCETRRWLKAAAMIGLCAVIAQGILGGITVLFFLPTPISVSHATLAQTFFLITIFIAYGLSKERQSREGLKQVISSPAIKLTLIFITLIYAQLIFGAIMRHTGSGLAIFDFPTMAGEWVPSFNEQTLAVINNWRFEQNLEPVTINQVMYHLTHRAGAFLITFVLVILNFTISKTNRDNKKVVAALLQLDTLVVLQIILGINVIWTQKSPVLTSFHVATGAAILGMSFLLLLRLSPLSFKKFRQAL